MTRTAPDPALHASSVRLGRPLVVGSISSIATHGAGLSLQFLLYLLLARSLGADGLGAYAYAISWTRLLVFPATLGLGPVVARETTIAVTEQAWSRLRGLLTWSRRTTWWSSLAVAAAMLLGVVVAQPHLDASLHVPLLLACPVLVLSARTWIERAALQGMNRVVQAQFADIIIKPAVLLSLVALWALWRPPTPSIAVLLTVAAAGAGFVWSRTLFERAIPHDARRSEPTHQTRQWIRAAVPMVFVNAAAVLLYESSVVMLGALTDAKSVGVYSIASRLALLPGFVLTAANMAFQPIISKLYATRDFDQLQRLAVHQARLMSLVTAPAFVLLWWAAGPLLRLFGDEFASGAGPLWVLTLGMLVHVATGAVGIILMATRNERDLAACWLLAAISTIGLNLAWIPTHGALGAAAGTAVGTVVMNLAALVVVRRRLGIFVSIFALRRAQ